MTTSGSELGTQERKSQEDEKMVEIERERKTFSHLGGVEIGSMARGKLSHNRIENLEHSHKATSKDEQTSWEWSTEVLSRPHHQGGDLKAGSTLLEDKSFQQSL